ncbi:MAG: PaaI family thioesterase [Clostridiales Family XIII bacterium]|jgi:acyl-CoA thioesterase|nr:PaaI family thioesterase [Clostridiales Family XIII bacterium]
MTEILYDSGEALARVRAKFTEDGYLTMTGVEIEELGRDSCLCRMTVAPMHLNFNRVAQGGAVYTLADSAFAVACNVGHILGGEPFVTVSQSASISYLKGPVEGDVLYAFARRAGGGKRSSVYRIDVTAEDGSLIATMTGNAVTVARK